jgi:phosphoglycerate kinase
MILQGRPTGYKYAMLSQSPSKHAQVLQLWQSEKGRELTTFVSLLSGPDKKKILNWSTKSSEGFRLSDSKGAGKTDLFASLDVQEKVALLQRFLNDIDEDTMFPQLRHYNGFMEELTLKPIAVRLEELLNAMPEYTTKTVVKFAPDCMNAHGEVAALKPGEVLLLENIRFYSDENSKDESERLAMARRLASLGDYFVSDAFATSHRHSATIVGIPQVLGHGCCGYLMKREIEAYADLLGEPPRPIVAVVGGVKVSEKIQLIENILPQIDNIIIGGAIAFTFLKVQGYSIGSSFNQSGQSFTDTYGHKTNIDELAARFLAKAKTHNVKVLLPVDHICHIKCVGTDTPWITADANVPDGYMALDIGPRTIEMYRSCIETSQTAVWSGPMGVFEIPTYSTGTFVVAKAMGDGTQDRGLVSIIGGGASATSARMSGHDGRVSHISSGGGASLDLLLEGKNLPGISVLDDL